MPYTRKTKDLYIVQGLYFGTWEDLTQSYDHKEAREDLKAYRKHEKGTFRLTKKREKIQA